MSCRYCDFQVGATYVLSGPTTCAHCGNVRRPSNKEGVYLGVVDASLIGKSGFAHKFRLTERYRVPCRVCGKITNNISFPCKSGEGRGQRVEQESVRHHTRVNNEDLYDEFIRTSKRIIREMREDVERNR